MSDKNRDQQGKSGKANERSDNEASLQVELDRETAEGGDSVGDVKANRTLSGSSSWETLPSEGDDATDDSAKREAP